MGRVEHADPVAGQVGVEVLANVVAGELRRGRVVEGAANDGDSSSCRPSCMVVGQERIVVSARAGGRLAEPIGVAAAPAVIAAGDAAVDLFPGILAHVV